jgi:hypothetical protein
MAAAAATVNHAKPASPFKFSAKIAGSIYVSITFSGGEGPAPSIR